MSTGPDCPNWTFILRFRPRIMKRPCSTKNGMRRPCWTETAHEKNFAGPNRSARLWLDQSF